MAISTIQDRVNFVKLLELPDIPPELAALRLPQVPRTDNQPAADVDAGSLVSFVAGVSSQHQSDALNSILLAQLAANKKFDREKETVEWYKFYRNVLENVGWVVAVFDFTKFNTAGTTFTVDAVVAEILAAIATQDDKKIIDSTINAVKALDTGDGRLTIWDQNSVAYDRGNFQISACSESDGVLVAKLATFYFKTDKTVTRVLWFEFSESQTTFYKGGQTINLNEDVYGQVREAVIEKLGINAQKFIGNLDI